MPPRVKATDLTEVETAYLDSCLVNYRSTPTSDKEDFRNNCVRYIMRARSLPEHEFTFEHFSTKVRNWFQNHTPKSKGDSLPINVKQRVSAKRAWAMANDKVIRDSVEKRKASAGGEDLFHLNAWNDEVRQLWEQVPEPERAVYERVAKKWTLEGPDDSVKAVIAQKRAPKWMRSVTYMFWHECNMPIFIYGMYKDSEGDLHAAVYDTSNLWREDNKTTPLLRNIPGWDQDFRRVAWNFFQATLRPDLAAAETLQVMKAAKRLPPAPFQFELYPDSTPILVDSENGKPVNGGRMQEIFREYMKAHYNLAAGREMRSPPWGSLAANASKFFDEGMLPEGFQFNDPSHIPSGMLTIFYAHVINMECANPPTRFRFSHYETGVGDNRQYHPAVYNGIVKSVAPRRAKKGVVVPEFEDPPSPPADDSTAPTERSTTSPTPIPAPMIRPINSILAVSLDAARAELDAERVATAGPSNNVPDVPARTQATGRNLTEDGFSLDTPWIDAEIDAALPRTDDDEIYFTDDEFIPEPQHDDASDDEVENELMAELVREAASALLTVSNNVPPSQSSQRLAEARGPSTTAGAQMCIASSSSAAGGVRPASTGNRGALIPPCEVSKTPGSRLTYLEGLADDPEYIALLTRLWDTLQVVVPVKAQNPVFWGTWGYKSAHVPQAVHGNDKKAAQLMQWISKTRDASGSPAEKQRFCLVIGLTLRDLSVLASIDGTSPWPDDIPTFMACSSLEGVERAEILKVCERAFSIADAVHPVAAAKGKGKALAAPRGRAAAASVGVDAADGSSGQALALRRSSRAVVKHS